MVWHQISHSVHFQDKKNKQKPPSHHCVDVRGDHRTCLLRSKWAHSGRAAAQIRFIASATVSLLPSLSFNVTFPSIIAFVCLILSPFPNLLSPLHFLHLSPAHIHPSLCLHLHSSIAITLPLSDCLLVLTIHHIRSCLIIIAVIAARNRDTIYSDSPFVVWWECQNKW